MSEIVFEPYTGCKYDSARCRLLIVGESHYDEPSDIPLESTRTVVERWRSGEWNVRYLMVASRIITGKEAHEVDRQTALDEVAFYNFVQTMMRKGERPTEQQAQASQGAFLEVLHLLSPTHIIMGSYFAWESAPAGQCRTGHVSLDGMTLKAREYLTPKGQAVAIPLPHFSRASAPEWQRAVREFLDQDRPTMV